MESGGVVNVAFKDNVLPTFYIRYKYTQYIFIYFANVALICTHTDVTKLPCHNVSQELPYFMNMVGNIFCKRLYNTFFH